MAAAAAAQEKLINSSNQEPGARLTPALLSQIITKGVRND